MSPFRRFLSAITAVIFPLAPLLSQGQAPQAIELGLPFRDNAILQHEMPVPVWGWSKPGATVTVEFSGQKESTTAGADGKWALKLKPLKASSEPAEMVVQESGNKAVLKNILVGEVWHASGQSTWSGLPANRCAWSWRRRLRKPKPSCRSAN
jgi:sialate O-acetylesterase